MTEDDRQPEDVAGLFRKFGGDAAGYREFAPAPDAARPAGAWALVSGAREDVPAPSVVTERPAPPPTPPATATPTARFAQLRAEAPAPAVHAPAPAPAVVPVFAPTPTPTPAPTLAPASATRELDILFARLAGQPPLPADVGSGPLSRWRRPA